MERPGRRPRNNSPVALVAKPVQTAAHEVRALSTATTGTKNAGKNTNSGNEVFLHNVTDWTIRQLCHLHCDSKRQRNPGTAQAADTRSRHALAIMANVRGGTGARAAVLAVAAAAVTAVVAVRRANHRRRKPRQSGIGHRGGPACGDPAVGADTDDLIFPNLRGKSILGVGLACIDNVLVVSASCSREWQWFCHT